MSARRRPLGHVDYAALVHDLRDRRINYDPEEVRPPGWNFDTHRWPLPREQPGPPEPGGVWEVASRLVRDYEFSPPDLVRAVYHRREPLLGRNMLLEARFYGLRYYLGVRVTAVVDESRPGGQRVWGWAYETLERHLERGRVRYEVVKHVDTGLVEFVVTAYSQPAPTLGPLTRLGWSLFGRRTQLSFYRKAGRRLLELVGDVLAGVPVPTATAPTLEIEDLVLAPSGTAPHPLERLTVRLPDPAR